MPYEIREREKGFQVCKKGSRRCYSNDPLPLNRAERQLKALYASDASTGSITDVEADMEGAGFFGNLLKRTFTGITDFIVRPRGFEPSKHTQGWLRRPFDMPPLEDLAKMVASTYKDADPQIQGYTLLSKTPTVSFFQVNRKRNVIIIALRGTAFTDINDISADLGIVKTIVEDANTARNVRNSQRYINDVKTIKDFQNTASQYLPRPSANLVYYAVGHSLSGAMIDELLDDGLVKSAVSFNPAIERVNFAKDNDNHRVYLSCDVLYNLLGKFITNGNLEVVEKENPAGADAGAIDASKGTIKCHNIETVIPYMSGKGVENNISNNYKAPMSFQDLINRSSSFRGDKFQPIGRQPCFSTMEYAPCFDEEGRMYNNPSAAACEGKKCVSRSPIFRASGGGLDELIGHIGRTIANEASKGNVFGRFNDMMNRGAERRKAEQDADWKGSILGKVGIPNPMKLFGGAKEYVPSHMLSREEAERRFYEGNGRPYTFEEWDDKICSDNPHSRLYKKGQQIKARGDKWRGLTLKEWDEKLCSGEDSLLAKKKKAIDARAAKKKPSSAPARRETQDEIDERIRQKQDVELAKLDTYANPNLSQVARMKMLMSGERPMVREEGDQDKFNELAAKMMKGDITRKEAVKAAAAAPVRYANAQEAKDALRKSMMKSSSSQKDLLRQLSAAMRR